MFCYVFLYPFSQSNIKNSEAFCITSRLYLLFFPCEISFIGGTVQYYTVQWKTRVVRYYGKQVLQVSSGTVQYTVQYCVQREHWQKFKKGNVYFCNRILRLTSNMANEYHGKRVLWQTNTTTND